MTSSVSRVREANQSDPEPGEPPLLDVRDVSMRFGEGDASLVVFEHANFQVNAGEFVTIVGPSGCGKSTMLNVIVGLARPTSGEVLIKNELLKAGDDRVGYVTQRDSLFPWRTLQENVEYVLEVKGVPKEERRQKVRDLIAMVNLEGFEDRYPYQLSGGMRQRAMIIRSLAAAPEVLVLDEPFGALDAQTRGQLQNELQSIQASTGQTMLFVTHDLSEAVLLADRVVVFGPRPQGIVAQHEVEISRPRDSFRVQEEPNYHPVHAAVVAEVMSTGSPAATTAGPRSAPTRRARKRRSSSTGPIHKAKLAASNLVFVFALLALWQLASGRLLDSFFVSRPTDVAKQLWNFLGDSGFWNDMHVTLVELLLGFIAGAVPAFVIALLVIQSSRVVSFLDPYFTGAYGIPKSAMAPLFVAWFGIDTSSKIAMGAVGTFFVVYFNFVAGLRDVDPALLDVSKVSGARRLKQFASVRLPAALPGLFTGIKVALPLTLVMVIVAEFISSDNGLGYRIVQSSNNFKISATIATLIVLGLIVMVLNFLLVAVERRLLRWRPTEGIQ